MLKWIITSSMKIRIVVVAIAILIIYFGFGQLTSAPIDILPEFSRPYVQIHTEALGLSAAEVEALITTPLEADMLNGVSWVDEIRSESITGLSSIVLIFEPGTDIMAARQMVQERLVSVFALPNVSKAPVMLNPMSSTSRCMMVGLKSKKLSKIDVSVLARWTIVPRLMGVPGVANVAIWGYRDRQLQVQVDPKQLQKNNLTLNQIISTTGNALWVSPLSFLNASTPGTGGFFDTPNQRLGIRHILPITTPEELSKVTIEGSKATLGEVSDIVEEHQPLIGDALVDETPNLILIVEKFPWANTVEVTKGVESALQHLQPGLADLEINSSLFRPATFIGVAVENITEVILYAGLLIVLALILFFYNWRFALIGFLSITLSILIGLEILYLQGITINLMILAGLVIALGVIIDDVITDVENLMTQLKNQDSGSNKSIPKIILEA
jgi:Cu/Ag efflux pump CusA